MTRLALILLAMDLVILLGGLLLQNYYLRHLRHNHRPQWETMKRKAPRSWRYFKGMPSTGWLIASIVGDKEYRENESQSYKLLAWGLIFMNIAHPLLLGGALAMLLWVVFV